MKFDVVVGNPPYQKEDEGYGASAIPIYNDFIEWSFRFSDKTVLVTPSRWFVGGKGLDDFRERMLKRTDICYINHYENENSPFSTVDLPGGVNWFYRDKQYEGQPKLNGESIDLRKYDILLDKPKVYPVIDKILDKGENFLDELYITNSFYDVKTNDDRLRDEKSKGDIKCYVSQEKGFEKWINPVYIEKPFNFWKVVTSESYGEYPSFGNIFIASPEEIFSQSYIAFHVKSKKRAENLLTYLQTDFANFFLSLRKNTQHISEKTVKWVPLPDLDRKWKEEELYDLYRFSEDEINIIKSLNDYD